MLSLAWGLGHAASSNPPLLGRPAPDLAVRTLAGEQVSVGSLQGALVVAACVGYLIYSASGGASEYYLTVSELRSHSQVGDVRVAGVVQDDVRKTGGGLHVRFTEKDATASMPVDYSGTLPDIFKPG